MVKGKIIRGILIIAIVSVGVLSILGIQYQEKNFLKNLKISQVESIIIYSGWGQAELSESEISDLINQLNKIELVGKRKFDLSEWSGMISGMFHIKLKNNKEFDFSASSPLYIINTKTGYEADYSIAQEIFYTYHSLLEKYFPRNQN